MRSAPVCSLLIALAAPSAPGASLPADELGAEKRLPRQETVVLLHGLSRTTRSMRRLETALQRSGYRVINLAYPAGRKPIEEMPDHLENQLRECGRGTGARVHFVTHSFGGIVLRHYLEQRPLTGLGRVVMLSPPNGGSELADVLRRIPVLRSAAGPNRPRLGTDPGGLPARLGPVGFELGVIAGGRSLNPLFSWLIPGPDDGFVSVERTRVAGMTDFLVVPHTHTFIMQRQKVVGQVLKFLRDGAFDHEDVLEAPGGPA